jgi:uncharacterized protein YdhG (YjbR/CyaY superfamily)
MRKRNPKTIDEYLAGVRPEQRSALNKLRKAIGAAIPEAEECISYQVPAFRLNGKFLMAFGAAEKHCAFYPGGHAIAACKDELKRFDTSKGTVRFQPEKPLSAALVRRMVKARVAGLMKKKKADRS